MNDNGKRVIEEGGTVEGQYPSEEALMYYSGALATLHDTLGIKVYADTMQKSDNMFEDPRMKLLHGVLSILICQIQNVFAVRSEIVGFSSCKPTQDPAKTLEQMKDLATVLNGAEK